MTWLHLSKRLHSFHCPTSRPSRYVPSSPGWPGLNQDRKGPSLTLREPGNNRSQNSCLPASSRISRYSVPGGHSISLVHCALHVRGVLMQKSPTEKVKNKLPLRMFMAEVTVPLFQE